jgi:hypothetical protein
MKGFRRGVTTAYITEAPVLFLGKGDMVDPIYIASSVPKYKQTTDR